VRKEKFLGSTIGHRCRVEVYNFTRVLAVTRAGQKRGGDMEGAPMNAAFSALAPTNGP
jgi:hypothetical protein